MEPTETSDKDTPNTGDWAGGVKVTKKTPIGNFPSIEGFTKHGLGEIVVATKAANAFPQAGARDLYCAYPTFGRIIEKQSNRILGLISKVLQMENIRGNIQRRQPDEQFEMVLECNDAILERLNSNLDEMAGIKRNPQMVIVESKLNISTTSTGTGHGAGSWNLKRNVSNQVTACLLTAKNIARPQLKFKTPVDNSIGTPFVPKLKDKPNSLKPLAILPEYDEDGNIASYLHPYEFELMKFEVPETLLKRRIPQKPAALTDTKIVYVDTVAKLQSALEDLCRHKEIAIDVEHHSYRTFLGFTCLIQISTRGTDYLFDAIELRDDLHVLNAVLTDPKVVKIIHGADSDIVWLQRDLSLYIVNMFDTHQAAKALNFARLSLSYLLKHYCDIDADKTYQLADWRIRPLPSELVAYARQDTHFLIYIYECISNDLLDAAHRQTNLLRSIYQRSTELCKKRYVKPVIRPDSHLDFFRKSKRLFDNRQLYALREIFQWRDQIARVEDESYGYVLPNHMMLQIAESLPREMQGILACCNPIPPVVRQNLHTLHQMILRAREQPLIKPILDTSAINGVVVASAINYNSKLYCPHDLSHMDEFRDDLPSLLDFSQALPKQPMVPSSGEALSKPKLSIFGMTKKMEKKMEDALKRVIREECLQFISPYQRYLAILPLVEKESLEEAARIESENKKRQLCKAASLLPVQQKVKDEARVSTEDDMYSVPVKDFLKRKYEEAMLGKAQKVPPTDTDDLSPKVKRPRQGTLEAPSDDTLKFLTLPPKKEQRRSFTSQKQQFQNNVCSDDSDGPPTEMPSTSHVPGQSAAPARATGANKRKQEKQRFAKGNKRVKFQNLQKKEQSSDKPVQSNFDYQNVDFKKFKGGSKRAKGAELKPQFHGKNNNANKANNKKFNKLFTFSNVKGSKK